MSSRAIFAILAFIACTLVGATAHGGVVDGYCYLECATNHCCTTVEIDGSVVHPAKHTDSSGHYGWAWVAVGGWHTFTYSHVGYYPETHVFSVNPLIHTQLPDVTLETKALCDPCDWKHYPYTIPGTDITFPYDEGKHSTLTYPIEWWYINFHLTDEDGDEYGGFVAFFKPPTLVPGCPAMVLMYVITLDQGIPYSKAKYPVLFDANDYYLCIEAGILPPDRWCNRQCEGDLIPFEYELYVSWVDDSGGIVWLELDMGSLKSPMPVGGDGYVEFDNVGWSWYYSHPRVDLLGKLHLPGFPLLGKEVHGYGWIDHQWADFPTEIITWEWLSIQLDDDREIMVADVWADDEPLGSFSGGLNYYDENCSLEILEDYTMTPLASWVDPFTEMEFATQWRVREPSSEICLVVTADFEHQVMHTTGEILGLGFWEGACTVSGTIGGQPVAGTAYAEATHQFEPECVCDVDGDGDTDLHDLAALLAAYGCCCGEPCYNPAADFNCDCCVDIHDLAALLSEYGFGT